MGCETGQTNRESEYYVIGAHKFSKKYSVILLLCMIVLCCIYVHGTRPKDSLPKEQQSTQIRTFSYKSIPLRFVKGEVQIKAKDGHVAYRGYVNRGKAEGKGTLYDGMGKVIYRGDFVNNEYCGEGELFYENGNLQYAGTFLENEPNGIGRLFRSNGTLAYEGEFRFGQKDGKGSLYDATGNQIYDGYFWQDQVAYGELIGKDTYAMAQMYTGRSIVYEDEDYYAVYMQDMGTIYYGYADSEQVDGSIGVDGIYVLSHKLLLDGKEYTTIGQLERYFGEIAYEGNTEIIMPEAVAIHHLNQGDGRKMPDVTVELEQVMDNVYQVEDFEHRYGLYLYCFQKDGISYTFFCDGSSQNFSMYMITSN